MKRTKHDKVFSDLVRERANYVCESCGMDCRHSPGYLHCSHVVSRRHVTTRWHPMGANAHCASCHSKFTDSPFDHYDWCTDYWGKQGLEFIRRYSREIVNWRADIREEIYQHYRKELEHMLNLRNAGEMGRIEFVAARVMETDIGAYDGDS